MPELAVDLDVLRHALFGRSLSEVGDSLLNAAITGPIRVGALAFTPAADLTVRVLQRGDKDNAAIFADDPDAHLASDEQSAWVKYNISANATARLPFAFTSTTASRALELNDYRRHATTDDAWKSVSSDLASPRTLLDLEDVRSLRPGEALSMELGGTLTMSVVLSWADTISAKLHELASLVPERIPIAIKLKTGLETSATVKVKDQFAVVVSRTRENRYRIAVRKAVSRNHALAIDVSLGAEANAVPGIEKALAPLFEAFTGVAIDAAERAAAKIGISPLTTEEQAILNRIAARLGVDTAEEREEAVRDAIGTLRKEIRQQLEKVLRWKASTGFAYEYARIDENTAIADYVLLDDSRLPSDYAAAMSGDLAAIAQSLRQDLGARSIVRYLNESTMRRRSASGFSLGIGKWIEIKAKDESVFRETIRTSLDGFRLITCRGTRRYDEKNIPQNDFEWTVDLKAQMRDFAANPTTRDFDYGLHYLVTLERSALSEDDLARMLDFAAMWDISVPPAEELADALHRKASVRVQLMLEREELVAVLGTLSQDVEDSWAAPLAAAMPYMSTFSERRTFASRREIYTGAWQAWLRDGSQSPPAALRARIRSGLILLEERALPGSFVWTSGTGHPRLRASLEAFMRGARQLHESMSSEQPPETIGAAYTSLRQLWSQRLYIAASGRYLLDRASDAGVEISRSLQIEYADTTLLAGLTSAKAIRTFPQSAVRRSARRSSP